MASSPVAWKYLNLTYPLPFVAHVEINRPEKLNAFIEPYFSFYNTSQMGLS